MSQTNDTNEAKSKKIQLTDWEKYMEERKASVIKVIADVIASNTDSTALDVAAKVFDQCVGMRNCASVEKYMLGEMKMKRCKTCNEIKSLEYFEVDHKGYLKRNTECRVCYRPKRLRYISASKKRPSYREHINISNKRQRELSPQRMKAVGTLNSAIESGKIQRLPCEICGNPKSEAHHEDYTKPLYVRWLCRLHHMHVEGKLKNLSLLDEVPNYWEINKQKKASEA